MSVLEEIEQKIEQVLLDGRKPVLIILNTSEFKRFDEECKAVMFPHDRSHTDKITINSYKGIPVQERKVISPELSQVDPIRVISENITASLPS